MTATNPTYASRVKAGVPLVEGSPIHGHAKPFIPRPPVKSHSQRRHKRGIIAQPCSLHCPTPAAVQPHSHRPLLYGVLGPEIHDLVRVGYSLPVESFCACDVDCPRLAGASALRVLPSLLAEKPPAAPAVVVYDTGHVFNDSNVVLPDVLVIDHDIYLLACTIVHAYEIFRESVPTLPENYAAINYFVQYILPATDYLQPGTTVPHQEQGSSLLFDHWMAFSRYLHAFIQKHPGQYATGYALMRKQFDNVLCHALLYLDVIRRPIICYTHEYPAVTDEGVIQQA